MNRNMVGGPAAGDSAGSPLRERRARSRRGWSGAVAGGCLLALTVAGVVPASREVAAGDADPCRHPTIVARQANGTKVFGTNKKDIILGTNGRDIIDGRGGDDIICGRGGDDDIAGWTGNDRIYGGGGKDFVDGGYGNDVIFGGPGSDDLYGGYDTDKVYGEGGSDFVDGGPDFGDRCDGGAGVDEVRSADTESGAHCETIVNVEKGVNGS